MKFNFLILLISIVILSCKNKSEKKIIIESDYVDFLIKKNADSLLNADASINALSIGIYKDGKTYIKHYGEIDKGKGNKPNDKTIYEIASVSKTFAGVLVAQAEIEGRLNLDDNIQKYLNGDFSNLQYKGNPIKIKHLITHTSGLPKFLPESINSLLDKPSDSLAFQISKIEKEYSREKFLKDLKSIDIDTIPGTKNEYSNADAELIGHILENIYKKNYNELIQEKICDKVGMTNTTTILNEQDKKYKANGYTNNNVLAPNMTNTLWGAGGGITSNLPDMIEYIRFQLDHTNETSVKSHQVLFENEGDETAYYWPISNDSVNGTYYLHHGGAFGTQNLLYIIPKRKLGITIFLNQSLPETGNKLYKIMDNLLNDLK
jgi:CubicO group peptidase (beta-lactamase class C family)